MTEIVKFFCTMEWIGHRGLRPASIWSTIYTTTTSSSSLIRGLIQVFRLTYLVFTFYKTSTRSCECCRWRWRNGFKADFSDYICSLCLHNCERLVTKAGNDHCWYTCSFRWVALSRLSHCASCFVSCLSAFHLGCACLPHARAPMPAFMLAQCAPSGERDEQCYWLPLLSLK